jgi:phage terminase small subunit
MTPKREAFARAYVENGCASTAYRMAFDAERMKATTIHKRASELLAKGEVAGRIAELQAEAQTRHGLTIDGLIMELESGRQVARVEGQGTAMISGTMAKAKLAGLDRGGPIDFPLPEIRDAKTALSVSAAIIQGVAGGRLTSDQGQALAAMVRGHVEVIGRTALETLLQEMEAIAEQNREH